MVQQGANMKVGDEGRMWLVTLQRRRSRALDVRRVQMLSGTERKVLISDCKRWVISQLSAPPFSSNIIIVENP